MNRRLSFEIGWLLCPSDRIPPIENDWAPSRWAGQWPQCWQPKLQLPWWQLYNYTGSPSVVDFWSHQKKRSRRKTRNNTFRKQQQTEKRTQVTCCLYHVSSSSFPPPPSVISHFYFPLCAFEHGQRPWLLRFLRERESASIWCLGIRPYLSYGRCLLFLKNIMFYWKNLPRAKNYNWVRPSKNSPDKGVSLSLWYTIGLIIYCDVIFREINIKFLAHGKTFEI